MRDLNAFNEAARKAMSSAAAEVVAATDPEEAISAITRIENDLLGDREAWRVPGNRQEGETEQYACGAFFLFPGGNQMVMIGPQNYGPEQKHMIIGADVGHPGKVISSGCPLLLENTDDHQSFVRILATFRAGSVVYTPVVWQGKILGVTICAAQTPRAMSALDLEVHIGFGNLAAAAWMAHGGPEYLKRFVR
jgi:hypothetical protein